MSPVNTSFTESELVGAVDAAILVYFALSFCHFTPFSFVNSLWVGLWAPPCLSFVICKMEKIIVPT